MRPRYVQPSRSSGVSFATNPPPTTSSASRSARPAATGVATASRRRLRSLAGARAGQRQRCASATSVALAPFGRQSGPRVAPERRRWGTARAPLAPHGHAPTTPQTTPRRHPLDAPTQRRQMLALCRACPRCMPPACDRFSVRGARWLRRRHPRVHAAGRRSGVAPAPSGRRWGVGRRWRAYAPLGSASAPCVDARARSHLGPLPPLGRRRPPACRSARRRGTTPATGPNTSSSPGGGASQ